MSSNHEYYEKNDLVAPINIKTWNQDIQYVTDILTQMFYALIHQIGIENWSVKKIYKF